MQIKIGAVRHNISAKKINSGLASCAVRHNISADKNNTSFVLSRTGQDYISFCFFTPIKALTGLGYKAKELEKLINQNLLAIE